MLIYTHMHWWENISGAAAPKELGSFKHFMTLHCYN